jgi:putative restriction endonuclease
MHELAAMTARQGYVTREQLSAANVGGVQRRLIDTSKGIWNPRDLQATLSVVSSPDGPYDDRELDGALFRYDYRAGSLQGDNAKLRRAMDLGLPIILLRKIETGIYVPIFPVFVAQDDQERRQFILTLDSQVPILRAVDASRSYMERLVRQRLHQAEFRGRVMQAYNTQCAVCNLRLGRLLEAAHIIGDKEDGGDPVVTNGLSLCNIHHAAYDADLMGITPGYVIEINYELLEIADGPMLKHGLQEMHRRDLTVPQRPRNRPDPIRLEQRYEKFKQAG